MFRILVLRGIMLILGSNALIMRATSIRLAAATNDGVLAAEIADIARKIGEWTNEAADYSKTEAEDRGIVRTLHP